MPVALLFVDDSPMVRAATTRLLAEHGIPVTALASKEEADRVDPSAFSAALLDLELDDGLGTDIAARLRRATPTMPIAFLTGGGPSDVVDTAATIGPVFSKTADVDAAIAWALATLREGPR